MGALLVILAAGELAAAHSDAIDETVAEFFRPFQHDLATLAPDGRHVAMTEHLPGKPPAIVIVNLDDRTSKAHVIASDAGHAVQQLLWVSPTRVVFTTRSRGVGALDVDSGIIKALLMSRDLDAYQPEPILGSRTRGTATADLPADPAHSLPADLESRRELSVDEALAQARLTGDPFSGDSKGDAGRTLRPFLLGLKGNSVNTILIEVRTDGDLYEYRRGERLAFTVGGNVHIADRITPPPSIREDPAGYDERRYDYGSYKVDLPAPPLILLEVDTLKGSAKEVASQENWRRVTLDQQGRPRIVLEQQGERLRYLYRDANGKKWVPLDSLVKASTPLGFNVGTDNLLAPRSVPLGVDGTGKILLVASNVGRDTFTLRAFDPATGQFGKFETGHERFDLIEPTTLTSGGELCFDPHSHNLVGVRYTSARRGTIWFEPAIKSLHAQLNKLIAPRRGELREWTADRSRVLFEATGPGDPGGFFVADVAAGKLVHLGERAPWLTEMKRNPTQGLDFATGDGRRLTGYLTLPRQPRLNPPPVLVYFHDGPWFSDAPLFNRGAQALAALGFAVLQVNHRGSSGVGRAHLNGLDGRLDLAVLEDVQAMLAHCAAGRVAINSKLVAAMGNGIGGYLAVRMAQLAPDTFRCAVAINAPGDLDAWRTQPGPVPTILADLRQRAFGTNPEILGAGSAVTAGPSTRAPVLVVHGTANAYVPLSLGRALYRALKQGSAETAWVELRDEGHGGWSEETTAKLFAELGRFFNATIYNYDVKIRAAEVVP